jgi:hypothetical protein
MKVGKSVMTIKKGLLIFAQWFVVLFTCGLSILLINISEYNIEEHIDKLKFGRYVIQIYDQIERDQLLRYFHDDLKRQELLSLSNDLATQNHFSYYEIIKQPVYSSDLEFPDDDSFRYSYNELAESGKNNVGFINAVQVSNNVFDEFSIRVDEGEILTQSDYRWNSAKNSINCLLGWNYHQYYPVGSTITVEYLNKTVILNVVGIMSKNTFVFHNNDYLNIDNYILMPSLDINYKADTFDDAVFQVSLASQKINGLFLIDDKDQIPECIIYMRGIASKFDIPEFYLSGIGRNQKIFLLTALIHKMSSPQILMLITVFGVTGVLLYMKWLFVNKPKLMGKERIALIGCIVAVITSGLAYLAQMLLFNGALPINITSFAPAAALCFCSALIGIISKRRKVD